MTWGRFVIAMVEHGIEVTERLNAVQRERIAADEALVVESTITGRSAWRYLDDDAEAELADLREAADAMSWGIGDTGRGGVS